LTTVRNDFFWMSERVRAALAADGRSCKAGTVTVQRVYDTPVNRPREIVPTNLVMVMGQGIVRMDALSVLRMWI